MLDLEVVAMIVEEKALKVNLVILAVLKAAKVVAVVADLVVVIKVDSLNDPYQE